jgi:hypothetical protein
MARQVPITITVSGGPQAVAEVNRVSTSFNGLNAAANQTASGGLQNSFAQSGLLRGEIRALTSQIPIVGQLFRYSGNDILSWARSLDSAGGSAQKFQQSQLKSIFSTFQGALSQAFRGKNDDASRLFQDIGINLDKAMTQPLPALKTFISEFSKIPDAEDRATFAANIFGNQTAKLLPTLEGLAASEAGVTTATTGMGGGLLAILGPVALVVAAGVALTAGIVLAGKGALDLTNLAKTTGVEVYDMSRKLNVSAETISAIKFGGIKSGIDDVQALSASLGIFDKNIALAQESDTKLAKQFKDFHVDISNNETALRSLFAALIALPPGEKQTELAMLAFGKSGRDMVGVVKALGGDIDGTIEKLRALGLIISTDDAKAAAEFRDKVNLLGLQLTMLGVRIGQQLMPYVEQLVTAFSGLAKQYGPNLINNVANLIDYFSHLANALKEAAQQTQEYQVAHALLNATGSNAGEWIKSTADGLLYVMNPALGLLKTHLNEIADVLVEIDRLKSVPKDIAGVTPSGGRNLQSEVDKQYKGLLVDASKGQATYGQFKVEDQARFDKELAPLRSTNAELRAQVEALREGEKATESMKVARENAKISLKEFSAQTQDSAKQLMGENASLAAEADQLKAAAKAREQATRANETAGGELDQLREKIGLARDALDENAGITKLATSELDKFNERVAKGKYVKVTDTQLINDLKDGYAEYSRILAQINQNKEAEKAAKQQMELADALQAVHDRIAGAAASLLPEKAQQIAERGQLFDSTAKTVREKFKIQNVPGFEQLIGGFQDLDHVDLGKIQEGLSKLMPKELRDGTAPKILHGFVAELYQAAVTTHELAAAQTPLGKATAEYDQLLDRQKNLNDPILQQKLRDIDLLRAKLELQQQEKDLNDPVLQQQLLENNLIRERIALEQRDLDAASALGRAQMELADKSTYHAIQANAQVAEFLSRTKSVTEIVASAKTGVIQTTFDYLDAGLSKANSHLGRMGNLLTQIEGDFIKLAATKFFQWLFGIGSAGSAGSGGGILGGIFGGGGPGGTPTFAGGAASVGGGATGGQSLSGQFLNFIRGGNGGATNFASTAPFLSSLSSLTNEGISVPTSLSSSGVNGGGLAATLLHEQGHSVPALGGSSGFTAQLAQFAPFLVAGIGASLGSRFGIGGQIGGGLIGAGAGLVASDLLGGTALSTIAATLGISAGALTAATFGVGAAVLVAAILIHRNAVKRKNETARATLNSDTYSQIIQVLNDARAGKYDTAGAAIAAFDQIKSNYFQQISGYDSKTKRIATEVWNDTKNGFEYYRPLISSAAQKAAEGRELAKNMIPEFAIGGTVPYGTSYFSMATGLTPIKVRPGEVMIPPGGFGMTVPGIDQGYDSVYTMARPGTKVLTKPQAARARGFATGGDVEGQGPVALGGPSVVIEELTIEVQNLVGKDDAGEIVVAGIKTNNGGKAVVQRVRIARADKEL